MSSSHEGEDAMTMAQTNPSVGFMSDLGMPLDHFSDQGPHDDRSTVHEHPSSTFSQDYLSEDGINLGFGDWLTNENFGGLMHSWPFVMNGNDVPPPMNTTTDTRTKPVADLQGSWYSHLEDENQIQSGYVTPVPKHNEIDDTLRQSLHRRLQVRSVDQNLPSVEYMNLCVKCYFRRFHPVLPVIHAATFRPLKTNSVLLLSICSIGSLLTGHPTAYQRGVQLFERLHKAILAHWEKLVRRGPEEALALVQASLIGQTFGMLSGQAKHLAIVDAFHGTVISLARRNKVFQAQHTLPSTSQDLNQNWKDWVQTEERIRVALGLRIHDAEIASLLHHETFLPSVSRLSQIASDALFAASSAQEWDAIYKSQRVQTSTPIQQSPSGVPFPQNLHHRLMAIPDHSQLTIYTALEDICSEIIESRINESLTTTTIDDIQECLISFYNQHLREPQFDTLRNGSKILWHYLFILLHSDLDFLEKSIGRDGPDLNVTDLLNIQTWANSASAQRCAAHTIMIKRNLESFPLNSEPPIHVPKCVFSAIICLFCYTKYGNTEHDFSESFSEFRLFDSPVASLLREAKGGSSTDVEMGTLYGLVDLLTRIGHWEVSRTFASIAGVLLQAESA